MNRLDPIFRSPLVTYTASVIGVLAGLSAVFSRAFPDPDVTRLIAIIILVSVASFFVFMLITRNIKRSNGEKVYKYEAGRYGIGYGALDVSCILDPDGFADGSATIRRKLMVEAYSRINGLETSLLIPEVFEPGLWNESSGLNIESTSRDYYVSLGSVKRIEKKQFAQIVFAPELNEGKVLTFTMEEKLFPGIFATGLSEKDVSRPNEKDYFGWNIDRPTRKLHLKVYFPEKMKPRVFGTAVKYNIAFSDLETARYQYEEQKRLKEPSLKESEDGIKWVLELDIDYPMIGLMYLLHWLPVSRHHEAANAH